jgi:hypothetical protein
MSPALLDVLALGIASLKSLPNENAATSALATALHVSGVSAFWTAKSIWSEIPGATLQTSWKASKAYDLSWAQAGRSSAPTHLMQVKLGTKEQEDQEVLLFLVDLAFASLDCSRPDVNVLCAAVVPIGRQTQYWHRLEPLSGDRMVMILNPSAATDGVARGADWIDSNTGRIAPSTRSQYSKIFGAGTNAKFVGLFNRPGTASIEASVHARDAGDYRLLVYQLRGAPAFSGPGSLAYWWP